MADLGNYGQHQYFSTRIAENQLVSGIAQTEYPSLHLMNGPVYHPRPQFHSFSTATNYSHSRPSSISPSTSPTQSTDSMSSSSTDGTLQYHPADYERAAMEYPPYFYNGFYPHLPATMRHSYDLYPSSVAQAMALNNRLQFQEGLKGGKRPQRACLCPNCKDIAAGLRPPLTDKENKTQKIHNCHYEGCDRTYGKTSHLKAHIRWHKGERPFFCKYYPCGKCFTRSDELTRHEKIHTKEKNYACDLCEKRFSRSDHLSKHRKIHTKIKGSKKNGADIVEKKSVVTKKAEKSTPFPVLDQTQLPTYISSNYLNNNVQPNLSERSNTSVSYTYPQSGASTGEQGQINYSQNNHEQFAQTAMNSLGKQTLPVRNPSGDQTSSLKNSLITNKAASTSPLMNNSGQYSPVKVNQSIPPASVDSLGQSLNQISYSQPQIHLPTAQNNSNPIPYRSSYNTDSILAVNPFSVSASESYIPTSAANWINQNSPYMGENSSTMYYNGVPGTNTAFSYSSNNHTGY